MYLVRTRQGDKFIESAYDVKQINKNDVLEVFMLEKLDYDSIASTSEIRDCIYNYLKGDQVDRDTVNDKRKDYLCCWRWWVARNQLK